MLGTLGHAEYSLARIRPAKKKDHQLEARIHQSFEIDARRRRLHQFHKLASAETRSSIAPRSEGTAQAKVPGGSRLACALSNHSSPRLRSEHRVLPRCCPKCQRCQVVQNRSRKSVITQTVTGAPEEIRTPDPQIRSLKLLADTNTPHPSDPT